MLARLPGAGREIYLRWEYRPGLVCVYAYSKFPVSGARSAVFLAYARCLWVTWAMLRGDLRAFGAGAAGPTVLHTNPEGWRIILHASGPTHSSPRGHICVVCVLPRAGRVWEAAYATGPCRPRNLRRGNAGRKCSRGPPWRNYAHVRGPIRAKVWPQGPYLRGLCFLVLTTLELGCGPSWRH